MDSRMKRSIAVCAGLLALASPAAAESPVAVVEEVQGKVTGAEFMDYVTPKAVIKIGDGGSIVLSYMNSCRREKISGDRHRDRRHRGERRPSRRRQGRKDRLRFQAVACDDPGNQRRRRHGAAQRGQRRIRIARASADPLRRLAVRGGQRTRHAGPERLDVAGERQQIRSRRHSAQGQVLRFRSADRALAPGGLYAATFKSSKIVFRVDPQAKPGATPIVGRLLRME